MEKIQLSLSEDGAGNGSKPVSTKPVRTPLAGYMAVGFGLLGIFGPAIFFTPLGLVFSVVALLRGQGTWSFVGLLLAVGGVLSSPLMMGLAGLGAIYMTFDWQEIMKPVYDMLGGGIDI